jgi:transposase
MLLPPSVEDFVAKDDPVRFVAQVVASMDLAALNLVDADPSAAGAPAYSVRVLLSVWLYGYLRRIRSTRQLEVACRERLPLMWITGRTQPDHNTLWRFFRRNRKAIREVFAKVVLLARINGMVSMVVHALDGTKLQAASSMEKSLHRDDLSRMLAKIRAAIQEIETKIEEAHATDEGDEKLPAQLVDEKARKQRIEEQLAQLDEAETNHLSPLEPDARPMGIRGTNTKLAFNAQTVVDDQQLIVAQTVGNNASDVAELMPMVMEAKETTGSHPEHTLVDGGYVSARNLKAVHDKGVDLVVPDRALENGEAHPDNPFDKTHFTYDRERDGYLCPLGQFLPLERLTRDKAGSAEKAVYRCPRGDCPSRTACTKDPMGRTVRRSPDDAAIAKQRAKQEDPRSRELYGMRQQIVEPVFGQIKQNDGFRRFTVRGLENVKTQWSLVCTAHNLRKMYRLWIAIGATQLRAA